MAPESTGIAGDYVSAGGMPPAAVSPGADTNYRGEESGSEMIASADEANGEPATAHDGREGPLRIYTAYLTMAVHQVSQRQDQVEVIARELGGHLGRRIDNAILIRVPADAFDEALRRIQEMGDIRSRRVEVEDVSETFHDITLRIRTLEAMRTRVEQLLRDADNVEEALAVEQHLERITLELESLRGRIRYLSDRIAFSTIEVTFEEHTSAQEPQFVLPFSWLQNLGLEGLMTLQ